MKFILFESAREVSRAELMREADRFAQMAYALSIPIKPFFWPEVLLKIGVPDSKEFRLFITCKATQNGISYKTWRTTGVLIARCVYGLFSGSSSRPRRRAAKCSRDIWVGSNPHSVSFERLAGNPLEEPFLKKPWFHEKLLRLDMEISSQLLPPRSD